MIRAIVFDFDGLIVDTEAPAFSTWDDLYREHGCTLPAERWLALIGGAGGFDPFADLEQQLGRPVERELLRARRQQRKLALTALQPVLPGVTDYLESAGRLGLKIGLASSSPSDWVDGHLARLGLLAHFQCLKCAGDVECVKPDPALYLAVLDALGVEPDEAIALEDSPNGALAAKRAGIFTVAVPNPLTSGLNLDHADLRLRSLANLSLERLLRHVEGRWPVRQA